MEAQSTLLLMEACGAPARGALEVVGTSLVTHAAGARAWSLGARRVK